MNSCVEIFILLIFAILFVLPLLTMLPLTLTLTHHGVWEVKDQTEALAHLAHLALDHVQVLKLPFLSS